MKKAEARQTIDSLGLPEAQAKSAYRTISRATASEDIEVVIMANGDLVVTRSRLGAAGRQVLEDTISSDGRKQVVQKAFDASGSLIHYDPKGGTP